MPEILSEKSEMTCVEFAQHALRWHIAPPSVGSVKARLRHAASKLGWSSNRAKDVWYGDPRIRISADELRAIEEITGLRYGREELRSVDELIEQADRILGHTDEDFFRPFIKLLPFSREPHLSGRPLEKSHA